MPTYLLNLRAVYIPFALPTLPQLLQSLQGKFPTDTGLTVIQPRRSDQGLYKIILQVDDDHLQLPLSVDGKEHMFSLRKLTNAEEAGRLNANPRAAGKLYTLYNCTSGAMANIPNETFDAAVSAFGKITRQCEHQRYKGSPVFNGNRFFCLEASGDIPDTVETPITPTRVIISGLDTKGSRISARDVKNHKWGNAPLKESFVRNKNTALNKQLTR